MKIPKKFFVLEMANNHMGDVNHGLQMIEQFSKVTKKFPFKLCGETACFFADIFGLAEISESHFGPIFDRTN